MILALAAVGERNRSFSVMRPEFIPQRSASGLGDKFFGWPPARALGSRVSVRVGKTGKEAVGAK